LFALNEELKELQEKVGNRFAVLVSLRKAAGLPVTPPAKPKNQVVSCSKHSTLVGRITFIR
jgi:hypothetical protein